MLSPARTVAYCWAPLVDPRTHGETLILTPRTRSSPAPLGVRAHPLPKVPVSSTASKGKGPHPDLGHTPRKEHVVCPNSAQRTFSGKAEEGEGTGRGMPTPLGLCNILAIGASHHGTQKLSLGWRWPLFLPQEKQMLPHGVDRAWMQLDTASNTLLCCKIWLHFSHL